MLNERLGVVESARANDDKKVADLEATVHELKKQFAGANLGFKRDKFDPAFVRVRFKGFQDSVNDSAKIEAIEAFMRKNFSNVRTVHTDHFSKNTSFVHVSSPKVAKKILDEVKEKNLKLEGFPDVKISQALTATDLSRNWCLYKAEEMVSKDAKSIGKNVEVKSGKERGVFVEGQAVFKQVVRHDPRGVFVAEYTHLKLP